MAKKFQIIFDEVMLNQLKKLGKNQELRNRISKMLDKIEALGPRAGKPLDLRLNIYESKRPSIRLYFKYVKNTNQIYVFEYEMKTSATRQRTTIEKLKEKSEP